ncbi:MAG: HAD family hydrolase [Hungatella sp.]|jgi:Cof subfamily protein (haloacid dehalogenase superfamily)|nr:HAD family hydrolase [Hungatella sp.]
MNTRLIALDLDGTLLDDQKRLPERNRKALEACVSKGIYVVPCTGRTAAGIPEVIKEIPGIRFGITVNGGMLVDMQEDRILDEKLLSPQIVVEIYELLEEYHVMCDAYIQGDGFSERYCFEHMDEYAIPVLVQELVKKTRVPIDNMKEYIRKRNCMVDKLNLFFDDKDQRAQVRGRLMERGDILVSSSFPFNLEINGPGASKGEGILRLAQILGVRAEETMAFGDGENDLSMMEKAGISIAMENGEASIQEKADYIAPCNNDAGVAQMLEKMVLS